MWHETRLFSEFFAKLTEADERLARQVARQGCPRCGGPLHRGDYGRKPRGAFVAQAGEAFATRHSLCCGHCRKRALPPSVRFLGRRVYLEAVVLVATAVMITAATLRVARAATGVPVRTLRRWRSWWTDTFPTLPEWALVRARLAPPAPEQKALPKSLLDKIAELISGQSTAEDVLGIAAPLLAPLTTRSLPDRARFVFPEFSEELTQKMANRRIC